MPDPYRIARLDAADVRAASLSPYELAESLLGVPPLMVERQPIRPMASARSIASSREASPLHTDSQMLFGIPAAAQILVCVKSAERGGESTLVDGDAVIERVEREDEALARAAFDVDRVQRFYFGEVRGPTVALRGGHLAWTLAPKAEPGDEIGKRLVRAVTSHERIEVPLAPNEALIASNHRMLHGRRAFEGERELVRLLVWLEEPIFSARVHPMRAKIVAPAIEPDAARRMRAVFALIRGVPPARVARGFGIDEPTLYSWREGMIRL
jgi:hypothetical protein